jgi:hypothetical protein
MSPEIYLFLERVSPFLILWSFAFTLIHSVRIARRLRRGLQTYPDNAVLTELAGLPLTILQSVAFVMAALHADWLSMLLFLWWGPGFVMVLVLVLVAWLRRRRIDWHVFRYPISYLCKLYYLAYLAVFFVHDMPGMMFAFSVWIINDQYEKAFLSLDADRTRRTFHDRWVFRLLYPAGLLIPLFFVETPLRPFSIGYGLALLGLWIAGLAYVVRHGAFFRMPENPSLLRNMVYFPKLRLGGPERQDRAAEVPAAERPAAERPAAERPAQEAVKVEG